MKKKNFPSYVIVIAAFSWMLAITGTVYAETVRIGGTGFASGVMKILGESFEKQHPRTKTVIFASTGSSGGIQAYLPAPKR